MHANGAKRAKYEAQIGFHTTFSSYLDDYHRVVDILFDQAKHKAFVEVQSIGAHGELENASPS